MFLAMRFLHSGKITLCGKCSAQDRVAERRDKKQGLIAGERHYVHLSADEATARKVGARQGSPVILTVKAEEMATRGIPFWQAENGVWLTSTVAVEFLEW